MHRGIGSTGKKLLKDVPVNVCIPPEHPAHHVVKRGYDVVMEAVDQIFMCEDVIPNQLSAITIAEELGGGLSVTSAVATIQPLQKDIKCVGIIFGKLEVSGLCLLETVGEDFVEEPPCFILSQDLLVHKVLDLVGTNSDGNEWGVENRVALNGS